MPIMDLVGFVKNYDRLIKTEKRRVVLDLIEAAYSSIQPEAVISSNVNLSGSMLKVKDKEIDLSGFAKVYLLGFGKGSAEISKRVEELIGDFLTYGFVIDVTEESFKKIEFTRGTHPIPSETNFKFTEKVLGKLNQLGEKDLLIVVTCGGGSALLEFTNNLTVDQMVEVNKALLTSGANIHDMNVVRKHLSQVKGGGLAEKVYPATVVNLIFSDVPGNDLSVIASAPFVMDPTTTDDAQGIFQRFKLEGHISFPLNFKDTPKEDKYFEKVSNILMLSNLTALEAMLKKAELHGFKAKIYKDNFQSIAHLAAKELIANCIDGQILLAGGETTVEVRGKGEGGRNQEVVMGGLSQLDQQVIISSFTTDGWDNSEFAGAIGDSLTKETAKSLNLDPDIFLNRNDSYNFFKQVGDGIETGRLPSNVSDLFIVAKI